MTVGDQAREDQFLGCLLGLAIGDALGRPVRGMSAQQIADQFGKISTYLPDANVTEGQPESGEITDISEITLSLVESLTTNDGVPDPDNMIARLGFIARSDSSKFMSEATLEGIDLALEHDGQVPDRPSAQAELAVSARGVPIGLLYAVGAYDASSLSQDAGVVARLTHGGAEQSALCTAVAEAITTTARTRSIPVAVDSDDWPGSHVWSDLAGVLSSAAASSSLTQGVSAAIASGGATNAKGALAGALLGAKLGASGIPQDLIDQLDARIYLTLAAPWFYRTAVRRAGTIIDLRVVT